jgi:hypothetical protein
MNQSIVKNFWLMVAAAPLLTTLPTGPAMANPVGVTGILESPTQPVTVTEGNSFTAIYEFTNNTGVTAIELGNGGGASYTSGDITDSLALSPPYSFSDIGGFTGCGATLAAGASCVMSGLYVTPLDIGELDADSGVWHVLASLGWRYTPVGGTSTDQFVEINYDVTVQDPVASGPTGVPEPMSLAIFGVGLLGLAGLRRRGKAS